MYRDKSLPPLPQSATSLVGTGAEPRTLSQFEVDRNLPQAAHYHTRHIPTGSIQPYHDPSASALHRTVDGPSIGVGTFSDRAGLTSRQARPDAIDFVSLPLKRSKTVKHSGRSGKALIGEAVNGFQIPRKPLASNSKTVDVRRFSFEYEPEAFCLVVDRGRRRSVASTALQPDIEVQSHSIVECGESIAPVNDVLLDELAPILTQRAAPANRFSQILECAWRVPTALAE
jgi:hypothetical protein